MANDLSASERAYRTIRRRIVRLEFAPNQAIGETQLAGMLGVSRTPVREALTRLSAEGLVDFRSRAGTIVAPIRLGAVRSAQFVREKLEVAIIREAAQKDSRHLSFAVRQAIEEQRFAIEQGEIGRFFAADERMHQSFAEFVGRDAVWQVIAEAKKHMDRVRWLNLQSSDLTPLLEDHQGLLDAIEGREPDRAHETMERHLRRVMVNLDELAARHPDYFEQTEPMKSELAK
ncbi:MAG: GntR family transcriptional regulator [Paracoccus sp. (in: a-proteobacteria)]